MDDPINKQLLPGATVEVTERIIHRDQTWTQTVRGTIVSFEQRPTGSWFAHSQNDKLWLDRLTIRKEDGEISVLILDASTSIKVI